VRTLQELQRQRRAMIILVSHHAWVGSASGASAANLAEVARRVAPTPSVRLEWVQ